MSKDDNYWQGYIQKQNETIEICKQCKYRKKSNRYDSLVKQIKDKIEEAQKEYNKLDEDVDKYINDSNKDSTKYYENKEKIAVMQTISWAIGILEELLEGK